MSEKGQIFQPEMLPLLDGVTILELPDLTLLEKDNCPEVIQFVDTLITESAEQLNSGSKVELDNIDVFFALYNAAIHLPSVHPLKSFADSFLSYEKFIEKYGHLFTRKGRVLLQTCLVQFIKSRIHTDRIIFPSYDYEPVRGFYLPDGKWQSLGIGSKRIYIDGDTLEAINSGEYDEPNPQPLFFHGTNSQALDSIAQYGGLFAAAEVIEKGGNVNSGEFTYKAYQNWEDRYPDVLWVSAINDLSYAHAKWFDEYGVTFGIDGALYRAELEKDGVDSDTLSMLFDRSKGEPRISLPRGVPLNCISAIYVQALHIERIRSWASKYCPDAKLVMKETITLKYLPS